VGGSQGRKEAESRHKLGEIGMGGALDQRGSKTQEVGTMKGS
jgi:hypothetical protein